jgi:hypothetical protein
MFQKIVETRDSLPRGVQFIAGEKILPDSKWHNRCPRATFSSSSVNPTQPIGEIFGIHHSGCYFCIESIVCARTDFLHSDVVVADWSLFFVKWKVFVTLINQNSHWSRYHTFDRLMLKGQCHKIDRFDMLKRQCHNISWIFLNFKSPPFPRSVRRSFWNLSKEGICTAF